MSDRLDSTDHPRIRLGMSRSGPSAVQLNDLETHRRAMLKFAMLQLRDETAAEDCVQEALAAAIQSAERFAGESSVRTWLIGILKHKILDHFRRASREQVFAPRDEETSLEDFDVLFKADGHYVDPPSVWANPEQALSESEFFEVLEMCMERLPQNTARVFKMREVLGLEIQEICKELSITANNCWVLVYRARMVLRECLEIRWFGKQDLRRES
jgi:RNA polymerase sigma-70 factor (ECF subfamily)